MNAIKFLGNKLTELFRSLYKTSGAQSLENYTLSRSIYIYLWNGTKRQWESTGDDQKKAYNKAYNPANNQSLEKASLQTKGKLLEKKFITTNRNIGQSSKRCCHINNYIGTPRVPF